MGGGKDEEGQRLDMSGRSDEGDGTARQEYEYVRVDEVIALVFASQIQKTSSY